MSNRDKYLPLIKLALANRHQTDEAKLPQELRQIIHPKGGIIKFAHYQNMFVCGFTIKTWDFDSTNTWYDLIKQLQTNFKNVSEFHDIIPNKDN